jgi:hypothetical protein
MALICIVTAIALILMAVHVDAIYFYMMFEIVFFMHLYYAFKLKIVYTPVKICLLSRNLSFTELITATLVLLFHFFGFIFFAGVLLGFIKLN